MSFTFTSIPSLTRPLTFDSDCESFFGQLPAYQINLEALAAQCESNATTLLSMSDIRSEIGDDDLIFNVDNKGISFYDGARIWKTVAGGLRLKPHLDTYPLTVMNAAGSVDVLVLKPPSNADALTGTSTTEPITPANLDYVLDTRVGTANAPDVKTALNASGSAPIYACRAWVVFNGTGTVSIRGSANVSSVTDQGTGKYKVNFTTAMANVDYSAHITNGGTTAISASRGRENDESRYTTSFSIQTSRYDSDLGSDCAWVNVTIYN